MVSRDAKRRVIDHVEGNRKLAITQITSLQVFYYTKQHKNILVIISHGEQLNKTLLSVMLTLTFLTLNCDVCCFRLNDVI